MNETVQINRRIKARPPNDLRRKVLLKNFLREQMSDAPVEPQAGPSDQENLVPIVVETTSEAIDVDIENEEKTENTVQSIEDSETDCENRGIEHHADSPWKSTLTVNFSKIADLKLSRLTHTKRKSTPLTTEDVKKIAKRNKAKIEEKNKQSTKSPNHGLVKKDIEDMRQQIANEISVQLQHKSVSELASVLSDKFSKRLSNQHNAGVGKAKSILNNKMFSKKKRKELKSKIMKSFVLLLDLLKKDKNKTNSESSDSELKEQKRVNVKLTPEMKKGIDDLLGIENSMYCKIEETEVDICKNSKTCSVSTQCVTSGTDKDWSLYEIRKLERMNKRLREENQLLSESLSSIMADVDVAFNSHRQSASFHSTPKSSDKSTYNKAVHNSLNQKTSKVTVLRSRSMQEQTERRREVRMHLSSRSMCHHHHPYARYPPRTLYRAQPCIITPFPSANTEFLLPKSDLPSSFPTHLNCNISKKINRRSSMPERSNKHLIMRRSSCVQDSPVSRNRKSLLSLPIESFY